MKVNKVAMDKFDRRGDKASAMLAPLHGRKIVGFHADEAGGVDTIMFDGGYALTARKTKVPSMRVSRYQPA